MYNEVLEFSELKVSQIESCWKFLDISNFILTLSSVILLWNYKYTLIIFQWKEYRIWCYRCLVLLWKLNEKFWWTFTCQKKKISTLPKIRQEKSLKYKILLFLSKQIYYATVNWKTVNWFLTNLRFEKKKSHAESPNSIKIEKYMTCIRILDLDNASTEISDIFQPQPRAVRSRKTNLIRCKNEAKEFTKKSLRITKFKKNKEKKRNRKRTTMCICAKICATIKYTTVHKRKKNNKSVKDYFACRLNNVYF